MLPKIIDSLELDAHADDPERVSPRTLNRLRSDYDDPRDMESRRFGEAYRERVKARIVGASGVEQPPAITTDSRFWKATRLG